MKHPPRQDRKPNPDIRDGWDSIVIYEHVEMILIQVFVTSELSKKSEVTKNDRRIKSSISSASYKH
jgi:hypothetical protein